MKTQTDYTLVDGELDAVVGGRINVPRSDSHRQDSVPGSLGGAPPLLAGGLGLVFGIAIGAMLA